MKLLSILGLIFFSIGTIILISFGLYKFFEDTTIPTIIRYGVIAIILGTIIILISLIKERIKEKQI